MNHTIQEWTDLLGGYIGAATKAIKDDDFDARVDARDQLILFIKKSPQKVEYLDDIARQALSDLSEFDLQKALADISKTAETLSRASKLIKKITEEANKSVGKIKLENVIEKINEAKNAMEVLRDLGADLTDEDKALLDKIKTLKNAFDELEM